MSKLSLELEELVIESFDTVDARGDEDGRVNAWSETSVCRTISDPGVDCRPQY